MSRALVVFDTETATCRGAPHLLEIGAVRVVDGEVTGHFSEFVRPEVAIDDVARSIHGIDDDMVRDARPARDVIADFLAFAGEDWLVAHNSSFDAAVLAFEAARHDVALPDNPLIDTLKLARRCFPDAIDHKLETLTAHLDVETDVRHRALPDAVSCWKVLEACLERLATGPVELTGEALYLELLARAAGRLTLRTAAPKEPRIPTRLRALSHACRDRSRVTLLYGEDGAPARLPVAPRLLFTLGERGYLEAECVRSGTIKTYRLDRVQKIVD